MAEGVVDEDLADGTAGGEAEDGLAHGGVALDESDCVDEFMRGGRGEADQRSERRGGYVRGEKHVGYCQQGGEEVLGDHHLRSGVGAVGAEDVILGAVR